MNNHIVLPAVLVDDLTSALLATASQLEHFAGPDISAVNQSVIDKATDALEATRHHLNHPDNAGDRLRFATRLLQAARPGELAALDNRECFELAERAAWWRDQAEGRLTVAKDRPRFELRGALADAAEALTIAAEELSAACDAAARRPVPGLRSLADEIKSSGAPERIKARLTGPATEHLADAIDAALRDRGIRHYVDGIEPGDDEVILWPYGRTFTSVQAAVEFVTEAAKS